MKILQVCPYDLSRPGGVQRHVIDLAQALSRNGHEVHVVAPSAPSAPMQGVLVHRLGASMDWRMQGTAFELTWATRAQIASLLECASFDVAHFHTLWTPLMPLQLLLRVARTGARLVATFHDTPPDTLSGRLVTRAYRRLGLLLAARLDTMVCVSETTRAYLDGIDNCPVVVLPPCIDLERYRALARPGPDAATILYVGRLEPRKGVPVLVEAFSLVHAQHPRARLVICGDGHARADAERVVRAKRLAEAVSFTGAVTQDEKCRLYGQSSVLCAPSLDGESYGLVIAEAMAAGLPVVAAANPGYSLLLTGAGSRGLVPCGDAQALGQRLSEMLSSPALQAELSGWGRSEAWRSDVNARLDEFLALYGQPELQPDHRLQTRSAAGTSAPAARA